MHGRLLSRRKWLVGSFAILPALAEALRGSESANEIIKLIYILRRKPELSLAQFHEHWFKKHADLVRKYAKATKILRYTQSDTLVGNALRDAIGEDASDGRREREL